MKAPSQSASMHTAHVGASRTDVALSNGNPFPGSADSDLLPDLDMLVARSRDLSRNNGIAAGAGQTFKDNIVGSVLRLVAAGRVTGGQQRQGLAGLHHGARRIAE